MQKCMTHSWVSKMETSYQKGISTQASQKSGEDWEVMEVSARVKYSVKGNKILGCKTGSIKQEKGGCVIPAFSTKTTTPGITAWAWGIQESAEKSQRMTAALEKMPWSRTARTQPIRWMKEKVMGDLVMAYKSLTVETAMQ